jgi:hypothetical protein
MRLGSSDFHDVLETMPEITETLVIGIDLPDDGYWLGPLVVPATEHALDDALKQKIVTTLRARLTPRHVPDEIVESPAVPHTDRQAARGPAQEAADRQTAGEGREHRLRARSGRAALVRAVHRGPVEPLILTAQRLRGPR